MAGAVTGLAGVLLVLLVLRGCDAVRGTPTCGSGAGLLLLLAIAVAMVLVGALLLRELGVPESGSTAALGVSLVAVLALLFLIGVLMSWTMVVVVPLLTAATFVASWWVTTTFTEVPRD